MNLFRLLESGLSIALPPSMETNQYVSGVATNVETTVPPEIYQRVVDIVADQLGMSKEQIIPQTVLSGHADSLDFIEIVMALEEEFELRVPDEEAESLLTVAQIAQYIAARRASA